MLSKNDTRLTLRYGRHLYMARGCTNSSILVTVREGDADIIPLTLVTLVLPVPGIGLEPLVPVVALTAVPTTAVPLGVVVVMVIGVVVAAAVVLAVAVVAVVVAAVAVVVLLLL